MTEENALNNDWGLKMCPILNKQCLRDQCAWWVEDEGVCAIKKQASGS